MALEVKVILQLYPMLPAKDEAEREALRPIGRNVERYQATVHGMTEVVRAAETLGVWGVGTIEHHFWSEGYEIGPNPGILNAFWAAHTSRIHIGQLGYVMSVQNPIRVAEEIAILDHLTKGRLFMGFARGYQARWTNILGQHLGTQATLSDNSEADRTNREVFEEQVQIALDALTQDSIEVNTRHWQVPYPHKESFDWLMAPITEKFGASGEVSADGRLRRVSVVPAPYQKPHPPAFVTSSASPRTMAWAGARGFRPVHFSNTEKAIQNATLYLQEAARAGHSLRFGERQAPVRWLQIGDDMNDARRRVLAYDIEIWKALSFLTPTVMPVPDLLNFWRNGTGEEWVDRFAATGMAYFGNIEHVRRQFVEQWKVLPAEYCVLIMHYAQQPKESVIEALAMFMQRIKPELDQIVREHFKSQ
jgi:alkanesulfonate monooxygenase SsuD/methylene tetrahydromethanopterin reductase-like flavin-dependent oxidoreductase (luciferase family)